MVLVLTSQMSDHDLINHAPGILLVLNGALEPASIWRQSRCFICPLLSTPFCAAISPQSHIKRVLHVPVTHLHTCIAHVTPLEFLQQTLTCLNIMLLANYFHQTQSL